jgi:hypothetical protein
MLRRVVVRMQVRFTITPYKDLHKETAGASLVLFGVRLLAMVFRPCLTTVRGEDTVNAPRRRMNGRSEEARGRAIQANRVWVGGVVNRLV